MSLEECSLHIRGSLLWPAKSSLGELADSNGHFPSGAAVFGDESKAGAVAKYLSALSVSRLAAALVDGR